MTNDQEFDRLLSDELTHLPPEHIPAGEINPWQRVSRLLVWGILLQSITLNFWYLQYILPTIGCVLELLGYRALRRQNRSFRLCWVLSILKLVLIFTTELLLATPLADAVSATIQLPWVLIGAAITIVRLFFLWRGLLETQRQGGEENPSASAAGALVVWEIVMVILALVGVTNWLLIIGLLVVFILCLYNLVKLSRLFDQLGYQLRPAPVILPDPLLKWGLPLGLLAAVLGCSVGFSRLPMDWAPVEPPSQTEEEELSALRQSLLALWEPHKLSEYQETELSSETLEQVLLDLTPDDLRALEGAVRLVGEYEEILTPSYTSSTFTGTFVSLAVELPTETGIPDLMVIHYFTIDSSPVLSSECIQCWPTWQDNTGYQRPENLNLSGQMLYDWDGITYASPFYSLEEVHTAYTSPFFGATSSDDLYAEFTCPLSLCPFCTNQPPSALPNCTNLYYHAKFTFVKRFSLCYNLTRNEYFRRVIFMFQTNELVMYGIHGVCCVQGMGPVQFSTAAPAKDYYKLKPVYEPTSTIIYVPVDHPSMMRPIISPQLARQSLEDLPQLAAPVVDIKNAKLLSAQYTEILHTYDWGKLLKLVKSIRIKEHQLAACQHKLGATDQKFYAKAQSLLCEELAAALDSTPNEMQKQLEARLAVCS